MAATAAEKNPAEDGDVVAGSNGRGATRAAGARVDDGFVTGQAGNANVEEAAEGEAEEDDEDGDERGQSDSPVQLYCMNHEEEPAADESFEQWKREVNEAIQIGIEQLDRGEGIPEDQLDAYLAKLKALDQGK